MRDALRRQGKRPMELLDDYNVTLAKGNLKRDVTGASLKISVGGGSAAAINITQMNTVQTTLSTNHVGEATIQTQHGQQSHK